MDRVGPTDVYVALTFDVIHWLFMKFVRISMYIGNPKNQICIW